jgi:hypothetical protein
VTVDEARRILAAGGKLRVVIGDNEIVLIAWLGRDELDSTYGMVMSEAVHGWSGGVVEPVCGLDSDYLIDYVADKDDRRVEPIRGDVDNWSDEARGFTYEREEGQMAKDVERSEGEPHTRLTRICEAMSVTLENHPENPDQNIKAVVLLDDTQSNEGGFVLVGWDDPEEILAHLLQHAEALAKAYGIPFAIMPGGAIGGQG